MPTNECIPFYDPGATITAQTTAIVTGKRCVGISGNRATDGNISVAHAAAGTRAFGVAAYDAASGAKVPVLRGSGRVVPITCSANIAANAQVEVTTNGQVATLAAGIAIGVCITAATSGNDAQISLY